MAAIEEKPIAARKGKLLLDLSLAQGQEGVSWVYPQDPEGLMVLRHSAAHLLAQAFKSLFPQGQLATGPATETGFYYDLYLPEGKLSEEDLPLLEAKMREISEQDLPIVREELSREEARPLLHALGETFKIEILENIPEGEPISIYRQGGFVDLCEGPHVPATGTIRAFKLLSVAGAYWRGDPTFPMLFRVYGTAWPSEKELHDYMARVEEARTRDHRRIGKDLDLFHFQEEAPGMVFWHPKGWTVFRVIKNYLRQVLQKAGYQEIRTPQLVDRRLWEASGHWEMFSHAIFVSHSEARDYVIKPMNCPCHVQVFNQGIKSYRDLPLRLAEFGSCHRFEPSGTLHGLLRVRQMTQDDAHIFVAEDQMTEEMERFVDLVFQVYRDFGFEEIGVAFSTRPQKRVGDELLWNRAEEAISRVLEKKSLRYRVQEGEGAFYGPKMEFSLSDAMGRVWQCGTLQVDFAMPERLGARYIAAGGEEKTPVMLHRAILGSLERFIGILIEHHAGALPFWLSPVQAAVLPITEAQNDYAFGVRDALLASGFRAEADLRNEKINYKIREMSLQKIPFILVAGKRELEAGTVSVRKRGEGDLGPMPLFQAQAMMKAMAEERL